LKQSSAVCLSLYVILGFLSVENPTYPGDSIYKTLEARFHLYSFLIKSSPNLYVSPTKYGPIYCMNPIRLEQPGPPFSHIVNGAVYGFESAWT